MEWFIIFQSLAKLNRWRVKPDLWYSHSKIFGLTFPQILDISFQSWKWPEGRRWGIVRGEVWVCEYGCLHLLLGGVTLFPHCTQSTPLALLGLLPLPLALACFLLPIPPFPPTPGSYSADRLGQTPSWLGSMRRGWWKPLQGLSLKPWWWKDSMNLTDFSQENSGICLLKSKAFSNP